MEIQNTGIFNFKYSIPFEETLFAMKGKTLSKHYHRQMQDKTKIIQEIWRPYEDKILVLFKEIYKIQINSEKEPIWITRILPNSVSLPLIVTIRDCWKMETDKDAKKSLILNTVHELAHFFSYRYNKSYINSLYHDLSRMRIDPHYLIQAVEFGIGAELFGRKYIKNHTRYIASDKTFPYQGSVKLLLEDNITLNKKCLRNIAIFYKVI